MAGVLRRARQAAVAAAGGEDSGVPDDEYLAQACGGSPASDLRGMSLEDPSDIELHRLVAMYIATRWPVAVALNKVDVASAPMHVESVRERYPNRVVIPVSARAELVLLRAQAAAECTYALGAGPDGVSIAEGIECDGALGEAIRVLEQWGSTGTLEVISRAISLRPPTLVFPVADMATLTSLGREDGHLLYDCLQLKPLTTVGDLYECCKREMLCAGDLVRAEARKVDSASASASVARRDDIVASHGAIVRIQTRRASWQHKVGVIVADSDVFQRAKPEKISGRRRQAS